MTPSFVNAPVDPQVPQVLLFGHSGAGKSALLGGLFQARESQGETLGGEVLEGTGRLASLRDAVYRGTTLEPTHTELTTYTLRLRPWRLGTRPVTDPLTILMNDCSGQVAARLMHHPESLHDPHTRSAIARAVIEADALLLLVNAAADDTELGNAFHEFDAFLRVVGEGKATSREVGGFPVFLVLTQCDQLVATGDTRAQWEARVHSRADRAWHQFHEFLKHATHEDDSPSPYLPFGSIELLVHTVAIRQPRLSDAPGQPTTPFGIAELFRDCFTAAKKHRARVTGSNRRLKITLRAAFGLVLFLFLSSLGVTLFQPAQLESRLAERVTAYQLQEPPAAIRLVAPKIVNNKQTLTDFHDDTAFAALPQDLQDFVNSRLQEIADYERYRTSLFTATAPSETRTLDELAKVQQSLEGGLALPSQYSWDETPAGLLHQKWLADVREIRHAEASFLDHDRDLIRRGIALTLTPSFANNWRADVNALLADARREEVPLNEPLSGSPAVATPRGEAVPNRVPYEFERVYLARMDWETTRARLTHLRDLADALGLTAGNDRPEAVLVLPEPGPGVNSATLPGSRWLTLRHLYPAVTDDPRLWQLQDFPDPGRTILAQHVQRELQKGIRHVHDLIASTLGRAAPQFDTAEFYRKLASQLTDASTAFPEWGRFLHVYTRLLNLASPNPVVELATFLRTKEFPLDLEGFELQIPSDLSAETLTVDGPLLVSRGSASGTSIVNKFNRVGDATRDGTMSTYRFTVEGNGKFKLSPGETLRAELTLRAGSQDWKLVWDRPGSRLYPFDLFDREPRLLKMKGSSEAAVGVKLTLTAGSRWPRLPLLFPESVR